MGNDEILLERATKWNSSAVWDADGHEIEAMFECVFERQSSFYC